MAGFLLKSLYTKHMSLKKLLPLVILIPVTAAILWSVAGNAPVDQGFANWKTFRSERFGVEFRYPPSWEAREFDEGYVSGDNAFKPGEDPKFPLTHHSDATQVSIFPNGVPTEGVFGESVTSSIQVGEHAGIKIDYVLANGTPWGTMLTQFKDRPAGWDEFGFVWVGLKIKNLVVQCLRDGKEIPEEQCEPFGDTIVRHGSVSAEDRKIEEQILGTLRFIR